MQINYYSYKELKEKMLKTKSQEDINNMGEWFNKYGTRFWNGEVYDSYDGFEIIPEYKEIAEDEFELIGYSLK